ncbi:MAG: ABC transporter substrate-binding protein [Moorea sp. SIO1G6]|uniref:Substrate-binding domain-containing protein n=1 Tax=Moorena producens (strain JHB) TaxID=1454205 RepID=A0A1D9FZ11_MOOP1|nr:MULTISPECIES: substrate-binding domain-containing protein [Moorena]AOY80622.1 substrate-binding domain-containing protein [Moorena producens JHB]NET67078.1 ABC transporter substrate-binding protein [Moorena sp. SIO1G6]
MDNKTTKTITSLGIIAVSLGIAYAPLPALQQTLYVVTGTELQEPLAVLEQRFEETHSNINIEFKFQGSQELVNRYLDENNDFKPTILIPANGVLLNELSVRWQAQNTSEPFYDNPQPIAKTLLVGIAWPERGDVLFPDGRFQWLRLENAMKKRNWQEIGGNPNWGSFDFVTTDPNRSNSGQLTLSLWTQSNSGGATLSPSNFNGPEIQSLFGLVKRSIYQPPRSTDTLLQEFITRGPNEADVATVYESIALYRWQQAAQTQSKPYQIYYFNPTIETVSTAAIVRRDVNSQQVKAARKFIQFLTAPEQQKTFVQYGFRPVLGGIDLQSVSGSPWTKGIPGAKTDPNLKTLAPPNSEVIGEIQRMWNRVE